MEVMQVNEDQKNILMHASSHIEGICDLMSIYQGSLQTNQVLIKLQEALHWFNELVMVGKLKENPVSVPPSNVVN